jgi:ATP-dependent protease HslVU (ClpYQ) peptidase subunit
MQVAVSGQLSLGIKLIEWVRNGRDLDSFPEGIEDDEGIILAYLIIIDNKVVHLYEGTPIPIIFEDRYFASGSGKDFALAAMEAGKTAEEAVLIASKYDVYTGMGVDVLPC